MRKIVKILQEGDFTNSLLASKIKLNKNLLAAITGVTGSGKSFFCLAMASHHYKKQFNKPFPIENVCFSCGEVMKLLSLGKLKKGEIIILEEGGVVLGSLDFQQKVSKMMNYILQSFRSMNVIMLINLPVLSMLNRSARLLLHCHFVTQSIDFNTKQCKVKCLMHQLNQSSGKSYWKYPRAKIGNKFIALQRISLGLPPKELIDAYEIKKAKFLSDMTEEFSAEYDKIEANKVRAMSRASLTRHQLCIWEMLHKGMSVKEIAKEQGTCLSNVYKMIETIEKKGYSIDKSPKSLENVENSNTKPDSEAF